MAFRFLVSYSSRLFVQRISGTFEAQAKYMSEQRDASAKQLQFGTPVLADHRVEEESQRATRSFIPSASPSLQARRVGCPEESFERKLRGHTGLPRNRVFKPKLLLSSCCHILKFFAWV